MKLKANRAADEVNKTTISGVAKTDYAKDVSDKHAHTILVNGFRYFSTGDEYQFFFLQVAEPEKSVIYHPSGSSSTEREQHRNHCE